MEVPEETVGVGSIVAQFEVEDCDSGLNGRNGTRFSIIAGEFVSYYKVSDGKWHCCIYHFQAHGYYSLVEAMQDILTKAMYLSGIYLMSNYISFL